MKKVFIFFILILSNHGFGQSGFYKEFGLGLAYQVKVLATDDGGWISGGYSGTLSLRLVKTDKCGMIEWSNEYTSLEPIVCLDIIVSKFGGYALTGYSGPYPYDCDPFLLRIDDNGNVIYCKEYQAPTSEHIYSVGEDNAGNFFINGNSAPVSGSGLGNNFIIKTDSLGNLTWGNWYALGGFWALAMVCSDGGVLRCGGHGDIYKVNSAGAVQWFKYGYWSARYEPIEVSDGYVFPTSGSTRVSLFKTDLNGNHVWSTPQYVSVNQMHNVIAKPNGNLVALNGPMAVEFNPAGSYLNHQFYNDPADGSAVACKDIALLNDSSFIISGFADNVFNLKTDLSLKSGCADVTDSLDTIASPAYYVRDTSYWSGPAGFVTVNIPVTITNLVISDTFHCKVQDSISFSTAIPDTICAGEILMLAVNDESSADLSWSWYDDLCGGNSIGSGSTVNVSPASTQTYFLEGKGCDTTACVPLTVTVLNNAEAAFSAEFSAGCEGVSVSLKNESTDADRFIWNVNGQTFTEIDINAALGSNPPFMISLIAMNNSCSDTMSMQSSITSFLDYFNITVPNVFTPNNDGHNDQFEVHTDADLSGCFSIRIYDRWGLELFASNSPGMKWDGRTTSGEKVPAGTYFFLLSIKEIDYRGAVTLLE